MLCTSSADAVQPGQGDDVTSQTPREITDESLADPPQVYAELIRRGNVRFVTGGRPSSEFVSESQRQRLSGETRFRFRYRYTSQASWNVRSARDDSGRRVAEIRVKFRSLRLMLSHDVWLRNPPQPETFWDAQIVRHELDHVRISSDPQIEEHFRDQVAKIESFQAPVLSVAGVNGRIEETKIQSLIESKMEDALQNTTELVQIRYRELDRLTRHGLLPLPKQSGLFGDQASSSE